MDFTKARQRFELIERMELAPLETPIQELKFLRKLFPAAPRVYIKRDDFIGPLIWGNKLRKLEYVLAEARQQGADTLITTGGTQSNHARTTAQVARQEGFDIVLVLNGDRPDRSSGNHKAMEAVGAKIHYVQTREERTIRMREISQALKESGQKAFLIPLGASDEYGTLGFVKAIKELQIQQEQMGVSFDALVHASSSGGTQAGLILGSKIYEMPIEVIGVSADSSYSDLQQSIRKATKPICDRLGIKNPISDPDIQVEEDFKGPGYGIPSPESLAAADLLAKQHGTLLDQTYSAKGFAALLSYLQNGRFTKNQSLLFWHTGGTLANFQ